MKPEQAYSKPDDFVYFGSDDTRMYAIDAPAGEKAWEFQV